MFDGFGEWLWEWARIFPKDLVEYWKPSERWWWCSTDDTSQLDDIKIYGEVSFTHKVISRRPSSHNIVVSGRVDHGIGRILTSHDEDAANERKHRFYSLLLLVEAKFDSNIDKAMAELIVYLSWSSSVSIVLAYI